VLSAADDGGRAGQESGQAQGLPDLSPPVLLPPFLLKVWGVDILKGFSTFSALVLAFTFIFGNSVRCGTAGRARRRWVG
jgi:hypothetical protein